MKLDNVVLIMVAAFAALALFGYFVALVLGVVATNGLLLPGLMIFIGMIAIFAVVLRQRLKNSEDDHYENIER
ncbi:MAG: hypothetical protein AB8B85_10110 [Paracoccaceae bacterium]